MGLADGAGMSPSRTTLMSIAVITLAVAAPFSGTDSIASATAPATELGSPEAVESLQTLSHEAAREIPANRAPVTRPPVVVDGATAYAETADQIARVARALGRFESHSLELPAVEVWLFAGYSGCADPDDPSRQRPGYMQHGAADRDRVRRQLFQDGQQLEQAVGRLPGQ